MPATDGAMIVREFVSVFLNMTLALIIDPTLKVFVASLIEI